MNLINFFAIGIKLDTEKNQIHNKLNFKKLNLTWETTADLDFDQFNTFSKKANRFGWKVLRSTMFQVFLKKNPSNNNLKNEFLKKFLFSIFEKY